MTFSSDLRTFRQKVEQRRRDIFIGCVTAAHGSIVEGSPITGAPGQPVDTGLLRGSWQLMFESPTAALVATNVAYAPEIEEGIGPHGPMTLRSAVGGFHSVALTRANWERIVDHAVRLAVR